MFGSEVFHAQACGTHPGQCSPSVSASSFFISGSHAFMPQSTRWVSPVTTPKLGALRLAVTKSSRNRCSSAVGTHPM